MKLTTFLLIISIMQVSAATFGQTVTIREKMVSIENVIREVRKQTGFDVLVPVNKFDIKKNIPANFVNAPLEKVISAITEGTDFEYTIDNRNVMIREKKTSFIDRLIDKIQSIDVRGQIVDEKGNPLRGANIVIEKRSIGTTADENGRFFFSSVGENEILTVSYVGYQTKKLKPKENIGIISLEPLNADLDAVQVIAYGTNTRRLSVGSSTTVTAEEIEKQPVNNILLTLQGRVPGLSVTPNGGAPGASARIQIRGQGSITGALNNGFLAYDQPLFIIDGIPFAPQNNKINLTNSFGSTAGQEFGNSRTATDGLGPFNSLNPADIESITVLKDADATSIYGTQGSNGVILITTKKGKAGQTKVDFRIDRSVNFVARPIEMLNTEQYLALRREAIENDNIPANMVNSSMFPDLVLFDQNKYTNWYETFFNRNSSNLTANASISGGSENTTFMFNSGYSKNSYNFPGDYADQRYSFHSSIQHSAFENRLHFNFGVDYAYNNNNSSGNPNVGTAFTLAPNMPDLLDQSGNLVWNYRGTWLSSFQQYAYLKQTRDLQSNNLNANMNVGYNIIKGLRLSTTLGYSRFGTDQKGTEPRISQTPQYYNVSSAQFAGNTFQTVSIEPQLDYSYTNGKSSFTALLGGSYKRNVYNSNTITAFNYSSDVLLGSINGASEIQASDDGSIYKYVAAFSRLNYVYDQKYIVNLTGRRDGSSNFGPNRQFGNFGSVGLGWIFSEEKGFKELLPFMSYSKLSASYGTSGTDGVAPYQFQSFWKPATNTNPFQGIRPLTPVNLNNPDYTWGVKKTLNIGLDFGVSNNRVMFNATWYKSRNDNQLGSYTLPAQTGFSSVLQNFDASIQNTGLEFTASSTIIQSGDLKWTTQFNISLNRNKLIAFPGLEDSPYASYYTLGKSVNIVKGYSYRGVNPTTGLFEFNTSSGGVTTNPAYGLAAQGGDMIDIADLQPKFTGGFGNTLSYKGVSLTAFFQFSKQTSLNYLSAIYSSQVLPGGFVNVPVAALDHWKNPGDVSDMQKVGTGFDYNISSAGYAFSQSSGAYTDASYIRLKTLSLDYRFPDQYINRSRIRNLRIFANAQNLLTITSYKVGDPESAGRLYILPLQRTVALGLSFNF